MKLGTHMVNDSEVKMHNLIRHWESMNPVKGAWFKATSLTRQ